MIRDDEKKNKATQRSTETTVKKIKAEGEKQLMTVCGPI